MRATQLGRAPVQRDPALEQAVDPVGRGQRLVDVLLHERAIVVPVRGDRRQGVRRAGWTTTGASPSETSSSSSSRGFAMSARPIARACCSPPDSTAALRSRALARGRERARSTAPRSHGPRRRRGRRRSGGSPRRSGWGRRAAPPAPARYPARRARARARRPIDWPSKRTSPAVRRAPTRRSLAAACDLPAPLAPMIATVSPSSTLSDDVEQRLEVAVEAVDPLDREQAHAHRPPGRGRRPARRDRPSPPPARRRRARARGPSR